MYQEIDKCEVKLTEQKKEFHIVEPETKSQSGKILEAYRNLSQSIKDLGYDELRRNTLIVISQFRYVGYSTPILLEHKEGIRL